MSRITGRDPAAFDQYRARLCQPHVRFTPVSGGKYVAVHGEAGDSCSMALFSVDEHGKRHPIAFDRLPVCYDSKNQGGAWQNPIKEEFERNPGAYRQ
jgi:hypothetical protein